MRECPGLSPCFLEIRIKAPTDGKPIHWTTDKITHDDSGYHSIARLTFKLYTPQDGREDKTSRLLIKGADQAKFDAEFERGQIDARK